jgi:hypothetical protein
MVVSGDSIDAKSVYRFVNCVSLLLVLLSLPYCCTFRVGRDLAEVQLARVFARQTISFPSKPLHVLTPHHEYSQYDKYT